MAEGTPLADGRPAAYAELEALCEHDAEAALTQSREQLAQARAARSVGGEIAARYFVALALLRLGRFSECRSQINALLASNAIEHAHWFARAHHLHAKAADAVGDYDTALEELQAARSIFEVLRDDLGIGNCLLSIGVNFARSDDHEESLAFYRRAFEMFCRVEDETAIAAALNNIGIACKNTGRFDESEQALLRAAETFERFEQWARRGHSLANLASLRSEQGRLEEADETYRQAIADLKSKEVEHYRSEVEREHGELMLRMNQPELALNRLSEALRLAECYGEPRVEYKAHDALGRVHAELGDYRKAYRHSQSAHQLEVVALKRHFDAKVLNLQAMQRAARLMAEKEALAEEYRDLAERAAELDREARLDALTQTYNRRHLENALSQCESEDSQFAIAVIDVDDFKRVNDDFSHAVGDQVLISLARILNAHARDSDVVARYGGDEFVLLLNGTDQDAGYAICERIWNAVMAHDWQGVDAGLRVTISIGLAGRRAQELPAQTLARADAGLYSAKRDGKNTISLATSAPA